MKIWEITPRLLLDYSQSESIFVASSTYFGDIMKSFFFLTVLFCVFNFSVSYEESISEMLIQCNSYQSEIFAENRTVHQCEKDNFNEIFSYVIEPMQTRYSKQRFLCFIFLKDESHKVKFRLWLSHKNFDVDAVSNILDCRWWLQMILFSVRS